MRTWNCRSRFRMSPHRQDLIKTFQVDFGLYSLIFRIVSLLLVWIIPEINAVDKGNFKKCEQSSFCK